MGVNHIVIPNSVRNLKQRDAETSSAGRKYAYGLKPIAIITSASARVSRVKKLSF
ncbi:hypothetical protein [Sphingobacterium hungaricum]